LLWLSKTILESSNQFCIFTITVSQDSIFGSIDFPFAFTAIS